MGGRHAGWFVALDKGFYREAGLNVDVSRGYGSRDGIKRLAAKRADIGFNDIAGAIIARARQGIPIKAAAVIYGRTPVTIFTLKKSGIRTPKDLEGKTLGTTAGGTSRVLFPAFAQMAGINGQKVKWISIKASAKTPMLIAGKIDAAPYYIMPSPKLEKAAAKLGGISKIMYADHGLALLSNGILVLESYARARADVLRGFVPASIKGLKYAIEHPDEAARIVIKHQSLLDLGVTIKEIGIVKGLAMTPEAKKHGLGYITEEKMKFTRDIVAKYFNLTKVPPVSDLYTNEFLK